MKSVQSALVTVLIVLPWVAGCTDHSPLMMYDPSVSPPAVGAGVYDDRPWAEVLRKYVKHGMVDYHALAGDRANLDSYLSHVMYVGPTSTPGFFKERNARLAYYLNVYNACVLKVVIDVGIPETLHDPRRRVLEYHYKFRIDGRVVSLSNVRQLARSEAVGNARVEFAMCDGAMGSPSLSAQCFRADNVIARLRRLGQEATDSPCMVRVDHERQQLLVSLAIWSQREAFLAMYKSETRSASATMLSCLMHLASGNRRQYLARATGYDVRVLPFDRALNIAPSTAN